MIQQAYITEWANFVPWKSNDQIEQDLLICRALVEIYSDDFLAENLAFRGGTALNKLYLKPQPRYSEDIDLVQIKNESFGPVIDRLREKLTFLGEPNRKRKANNNTLIYKFETEFAPVKTLKIKVETNCREHFTVLGYQKHLFEVKSSWFNGSCEVTTYKLEELLGTKMRALYQRRKGRDLFDLFRALTQKPDLDKLAIIECFNKYMHFVVDQPPTQKLFLLNMEAKMKDSEFLGDIKTLIRHDEAFNQEMAYDLIRTELIERL